MVKLTFADLPTKSPFGVINNLEVKVGNCIVPINFHVLEMGSGSYMPPLLGRDFLATLGLVVDMPKGRISFANINENVFYKIVPENRVIHPASYIETSDDSYMITQR